MHEKLLAFGILLLTIAEAYSAPGDSCYSISNSDQKNFCLGTSKHDKSYCYSISNSDNKNMCLAIAGQDKSYCYSISNSDQKNQCLGHF